MSVRLALAALALAVAAPALAGPDEDAIRASARDWIARFKAGDIEGLMRHYRPDSQVALHGQPKLDGSAAIRAYFTPRLAAKPDVDFLLEDELLEVRGDRAVAMSKYWFTLRPPGKAPVFDAGRSVLVYQRGTDGRWQIRLDIDQASPDVGFPPPPTAK